MNKYKLIIIGFLIIISYTFLFFFSYGWIISIFSLLILIVLLFLPKGGTIIESVKRWLKNDRELKEKEKEYDYMINKDLEMKILSKDMLKDIDVPEGSTIAVGMSGGVDSSVTAYILKQKGYKVKGYFMRNWDSAVNMELNNILTEEEICQQEEDYEDAKKVADQLGIELVRVNFVEEYWDLVFKRFLEEIEMGITPNPDIFCNRYIKFEKFIEYVFGNDKDVDYVATGHYAKVMKDEYDQFYLVEAKDENKDQTYFLSEIKKEVLSKVIFPLSDYSKDQIRDIASEAKLFTANKKDSVGICFIGKRNFPEFISNYLEKKPGDIIDNKTRKVVGKHDGVLFYTIGQRRGLNLGGFEKPYFVSGKDIEKNILYVANDSEDILYTNEISTNNFNPLVEMETLDGKVEFKTRHSPIKYVGEIKELVVDEKTKRIKFTILSETKVKAVTSGQELVLYKNGICLGGGQIK